MGAFVNILIAPRMTETELSSLLCSVAAETAEDWSLEPSECRVWQADKGAGAWLNDHCCGYEDMTRHLSQKRNGPIMLSYIYDDDVWGYYFYDAGWEVDSFTTIPDFLEEISDRERRRMAGCSEALASYFPTSPERIAPYLVFWEDKDEEDPWQMADFLAELGFPLQEEEMSDRLDTLDFFKTDIGKRILELAENDQTDVESWLNFFATVDFLNELLKLDSLHQLLLMPRFFEAKNLVCALSVLCPDEQLEDLKKAVGGTLPKLSEEEQVMHVSFVEYWKLVSIAQTNPTENWSEDALLTFDEIIDRYQAEHIQKKYVLHRPFQRNPIGLQLIVCFLQQFPLPKGLYSLIWQSLDLKTAAYGRSAVLFGAVREQLLRIRPQLAKDSMPHFDALHVELIRYLAGVHHSIDSGPDSDQKALDELFARPDMQAALWNDTYVLKELVRQNEYLRPSNSALFLQRMCDFYKENPTAPYASILLRRFEADLEELREAQRQKEEQLSNIPDQVPGLSCYSFFFYWLNTFAGMMELPDLYQELRSRFAFQLDWARKFIGTDAKTNDPGFKKLCFVFNQQRIEIRFHLRYLEYFIDGKLVTRPCFSLKQLLRLRTPDRFFYLLPLMIPVLNEEELTGKISKKLAQAAPFLLKEEQNDLENQILPALVCPYDPFEVPSNEDFLDWLFGMAEEDEELDFEQFEQDFDEKFEEAFGEAADLSEFLSILEQKNEQQPNASLQWMIKMLSQWIEQQQAIQELTEEEKEAAFLRSLPEKVWWETNEMFFYYCCIECEGRLSANMFSQDQNTGCFHPIGGVQRFLNQTAEGQPASDQLRQELLNQALGFSIEMKESSYVSNLAQLPQTIYIEPDDSKADCDSLEIASIPRRLEGSQIDLKCLDALIDLYQKGALLRLELCWSREMLDVFEIAETIPISLVLMRDGDKWACFCFDDAGHDANQMIADPKTYLTVDCKQITKVPFRLGMLPSYAIFSQPDELLKKLSKLFRHIPPDRRPNFECSGLWSNLADSFYYNQEKYILDKRLLGGFSADRAHNKLYDRFYLKEYPTLLETVTQENDVKSMAISGGNRDMPRFYLGRFVQKGLKKLVFHFGQQEHLAFLLDGSQSMMVLMEDASQTIYFAVADSALSSANPNVQPKMVSFLGEPVEKGLVFSDLLFLRAAADLLFACWENRKKLLTDSRNYVCQNLSQQSTYEELRQKYLYVG